MVILSRRAAVSAWSYFCLGMEEVSTTAEMYSLFSAEDVHMCSI